MPENPEEKRQFPRIILKTPLRYQVRGRPEFNNCLSEDISVGGIGFAGDRFIAPLTNLMLEVNILSRILTPVGRVVWANSLPHSGRFRLGVEFLELNPLDKQYLADYLDMQLGKL